MFTFWHASHIISLLLYVDDIILIGSSVSLLFSFISTLSKPFAMKDLGDVNYFLGVQVIRSFSGLFLFQHKYISDLLLKFHLRTCKPVRSPIVARTTLTLSNGELLVDPTEYHSMVVCVAILNHDSF